jgi:fused signal recognition particle receptor
MGLFFRKKKSKEVPIDTNDASQTDNNTLTEESSELINDKQKTLDKGLSKSSSSLLGRISQVFSSGIEFSEDIFEELEDSLISCDIGVEASMGMIEALRTATKKQKLKTSNQVIECLQDQAILELQIAEQEWNFNLKPYVLMIVGVNGVGKTTTTAKIARHFQKQGKKVMLAAADTFRAAATEQLIEWGQRLDIPVIHQDQGADAAAVAHDAFNSALARDIDILIIDTAGRLHTQIDLMDQLGKVTRVLKKIDPDTPHEVMQILDATTGQNAQNQLSHFKEAVGVSSICLTKLDGSAKGGVAISLARAHKLPIRFIGIGEGFDDLKEFSADNFAKALIPDGED